jgi:[protein-PII] uridylyltransferase
MAHPGPARLLTPEEAEARMEERTTQVDRIVIAAFDAALAGQLGEGMAALAVGGFGRRELFPYSDVDVLLLVSDHLTPASLKQSVGVFVQTLWDAGLRLSHSVRTVQECCQLHEGNTELSISLIDRRFLRGDHQLMNRLENELPKFFRLHGRTLARDLSKLTRARHLKYQNTIYHLEPNLKETPGGLRDLHVIHWLKRLHQWQEPGDNAGAREFLIPLRTYLHDRSKRDDNVLNFEAQDQVSAEPEAMMRHYFRHARSIHRAAIDLIEQSEQREPSLLGQFRDWRSRLSNADFTVARERVYLRAPGQLAGDPALLLRLFEFTSRHGLQLARDTERRIREALPELEASLRQPGWAAIRELFNQKTSVGLRAMEETGVLAVILPEWKRIECLVVRDFYHRYTVDEHTLVAIEMLEHIEDARFRDLASEIDQPWLLRIALLLHDIGKGGGNHVATGIQLATAITDRMGVPREQADLVLFLVEQHLALSKVMISRDLNDAATGRALAGQVGTVERLKLLTLVTFADISAVNPAAMTPWRREQLWRTYLLAYGELTRELETERVHAGANSTQELASFMEGFPTRYPRTHSAAEIQRHLQLSRDAQSAGVAIDIERQPGFYRLVVATPDRPFLFASISGALAALGMNILKAEAFANAAHFVLDTFTFSDPSRSLELNPTEFERLRDTVARVVMGRDDVRRLLKSRPRPGKRPRQIQPAITFDNDASPAASLIEIVAEDRPGLLYDVTSAMSESGCNIEVVLIDTEAQRALDVFYVTLNGRKLAQEELIQLRTALLAACSR